jgi:hypothetical protein
MGCFFSVYSTGDLMKLDQQKRKELRSAIEWALQHDPDVQALVVDKLPEIRRKLREGTQEAFNRLRADGGGGG